MGSKTRGRRLGAAAAAFAVALLLLAQGISAPFVKDAEPESAEWIQSVASGRHWLIPRSYYGAMSRKPPLFYWLAGALSASAGGRVDEVKARAVSWLAAAATAVEVQAWTAATMGAATGWLAFFFLLGSYAFASRATLGLTDMLLCLLVFSAWCLLYRALDEGPSRRRTIALGAILGLGILTKGPVALVLPALAGLIYLLARRRPLRAVVFRPWPWAVLAVAVLVAAPWYAAAAITGGSEFVRVFFEENSGHFLPAILGGTGEAARPVYYIAMKTAGGAMPLALLLPALALALRPGAFTEAARKPVLFQLSLALAVVLLFSAASAKRDDYVLPAMPGLAIAFAALFTALGRARAEEAHWAVKSRDALAMLAAAGTLVLLLGALGWACTDAGVGGRAPVLPLALASVDRAAVELFLGWARRLWGPFGAALGAAAVATGAVMLGTLRCRSELSGAGLALLSLTGVLLITAAIRPESDRGRTLKYAAARIEDLTGGAPLYIVRGLNHEFSFYCGRGIAALATQRQAPPAAARQSYLFAYEGELTALDPVFRSRLRLVEKWPVRGKAGPPALYAIEPAAGDLQPQPGGAK